MSLEILPRLHKYHVTLNTIFSVVCFVANTLEYILNCIVSYSKGRLDYNDEVAAVKNNRGMEQYNWLQNRSFTDRSLHYGQEFFGGELQTLMINVMVANNTFA